MTFGNSSLNSYRVEPLGVLTKRTLKQKSLLFLVFLVLMVAGVFWTTLFENVYAFIGFVLFASALLVVNISDALYAIYYKRISQLQPEDYQKEIQWIPLVFGLSMVTVVVIGLLMNISLQNYKTQASQVVLLAGIVYIFKEFWLVFIHGLNYKRIVREGFAYQGSYGGLISEWFFTAITYIYGMVVFALKLPTIDKFISLSYLIVLVVGASVYFYSQFKKEVAQFMD